jgi:uncharacterized protein YndB with AHSA1/START domain
VTDTDIPGAPLDRPVGVVRATADIAAAPERVFEALTDPRQLAAWWGGADSYRTHDWEVEPHAGGRWSARTTDADGNEGTLRGEYLVFDPPRTLEHTWCPSWDDAAHETVRYDLAPAIVDGVPGTRVIVTHTTVAARLAARSSAAACLVAALSRLVSATRRASAADAPRRWHPLPPSLVRPSRHRRYASHVGPGADRRSAAGA